MVREAASLMSMSPPANSVQPRSRQRNCRACSKASARGELLVAAEAPLFPNADAFEQALQFRCLDLGCTEFAGGDIDNKRGRFANHCA